jgi:PQQ-dependent dehydrogenase (methanol/ethanol family)
VRFRRYAVLAALTLAVLVPVAASLAAGSSSNAIPAGDWQAFGRTPDNSRLSPLTQITPANVSQLERVYNIDFQKLDPDVRRGQQSYPLAIGGRLYVTTNDDNVFALEGATGKVIWQYKPPNSGMFKNFGIIANRGLAYCDGRLFITQLDMKIVALRPSDGKVMAVTALRNDIPNASSNYGYSETSAPICANHRVLMGAAGSEYGIRGFVTAYTTDLKPAWPAPFYTVPPEFQSWRRASRIVGGGAVWTPVTIDSASNTVYFGTGSATPLYFPGLRPGANPRTDSLIAVDLTTGRMKWWQQLLSGNQWAYDVSQPPLVYDGKVGGKAHRIVSVATMEGVWFAFDAKTGQPFHERVKVIDRVEHPPLRPGQPVTVFPSSLGGLNYSPAAYDPTTNYVFNAAAETAAVLIQKKLTPTQKKRKFVLGDVYLGLENGSFGEALKDWHDHGSISAIDVSTGKRVWKFSTPEPERGGISLTASGLGFAGGGDGLVRAFELKTGKVLWSFNTGRPIASGPTIFSDGGKEYIAVTVGGTATSSNGGVASWLQVFALAGARSTRLPANAATTSHPVTTIVAAAPARRSSAKVVAAAKPRIVLEGGAVPLALWQAASSNEASVAGRLLLGGKPVAGARLGVDRYVSGSVTDAQGGFSLSVDKTLPRRHPVSVVDASRARVGGRALTAAEQAALRGVSAGISVAYRLVDLQARVQKNGTVAVSGRAVRADGGPAPGVVLLSYRLAGTVTDASGRPVPGATVVTRTTDRDFWTFSLPSNASGRYVSFFSASDEQGSDPVQLNVQVAVGQRSYTAGFTNVDFKRLRSAIMDVKLPASGLALPLPKSSPEAGAVYRGLIVGVLSPRGVLKPLSVSWPDARGRFSLVLPHLARGTTLRFWESNLETFSVVEARPGGPANADTMPSRLTPRTPSGIASVRVS